MRKGLFFLSLLLLLALSACGNGEAEELREENATLQQRVAALEEENDRLSLANDLLGQDLFAAQDALEQLGAQQGENPIDPFYDATDTDGSTAAMSTVAWSRANAWEAEARNAAELLKSQLSLQEDRDLVDAYLVAVEEQLGRMNEMSVYPVSDLTASQADRIGTVGTLAHVLWPARYAQIWRDTFYQLIEVLPDIPGGQLQKYTFIFEPEAARLELADLLGQS